MKTRKTLAALAVVGLLTACATDPHPMDMTQMIQDAKTHDDHEALAKHYDDAAKAMLAEVDVHKKWLEKYQTKSYLYGKQAQNLKTHCEFLIRTYQEAAKANSDMAADHRQMAAEAK
jgi:endonuclease III